MIDYEEGEAKRRSAESDAELFFSTCESLRQLFKQVNDLKSNDSKSVSIRVLRLIYLHNLGHLIGYFVVFFYFRIKI